MFGWLTTRAVLERQLVLTQQELWETKIRETDLLVEVQRLKDRLAVLEAPVGTNPPTKRPRRG